MSAEWIERKTCEACAIGGTGHCILCGRGDRWKVVHREATNSVFKQIVDYNGKVLAVDEWGSQIYEIAADGARALDTADYVLPPTSCLCLAVGHGMLLTAGQQTANLFDGRSWRSLFQSQDASAAMFLEFSLNRVKETVDELSEKLAGPSQD